MQESTCCFVYTEYDSTSEKRKAIRLIVSNKSGQQQVQNKIVRAHSAFGSKNCDQLPPKLRTIRSTNLSSKLSTPKQLPPRCSAARPSRSTSYLGSKAYRTSARELKPTFDKLAATLGQLSIVLFVLSPQVSTSNRCLFEAVSSDARSKTRQIDVLKQSVFTSVKWFLNKEKDDK